MKPLARHQCVIYDQAPSDYLPAIARSIADNLKASYRCLYLNSPTMVAGLRCCLAADGLDLAAETAKGSLILTSEQSHLSEGRFVVERMLEMLEDALHKALADGYMGLWVSGDMTWEFGAEKNFEKLLEYEERLEEFMQQHETIHGVCQYHRQTLPDYAIEPAERCHRAFYVNETLSVLNLQYAVKRA